MLAEEILLVNDGSLLLKMMGGLLENEGYQISLTDSPEEAMVWLSSRHVGLVVMKMNGRQSDRLAVTHMVKELNGATKLVIIGESLHLPAEIFEVAADDYILLPCRTAEIWRRLLSSLEAEPAQAAPNPEPQDDLVHPVNRRLYNNLGLMFHDLHSRLTAFNQSMKSLRAKTDGVFEDDIEDIFQKIFLKSRQLTWTAEEFLQKFQGSHPVLASTQVVDLQEDVVAPILEELKIDLSQNHIELDNRLAMVPPAQQVVRGDRVTLKSVFRNLLSSAINHGGYGSSICLDVDEAPTHFRLRVQNNGESPFPKHQQEMFPEETQKGRDNGQGEGAVLGWSLGREVMQSQGGDIVFESGQKGARFIMTLPRA